MTTREGNAGAHDFGSRKGYDFGKGDGAISPSN
jgi:hypothetical protein